MKNGMECQNKKITSYRGKILASIAVKNYKEILHHACNLSANDLRK